MPRLIVILVSLAALAGLAGCGASENFNPDVVAQAADKTASAGGAKLVMTVSAAGQRVNANGFIDTRGQKGRMSMTLPQAQGAIDMVFIKRVIYMHLPDALQRRVAGGASWLKLDFDRALRAKGIDLSAFQNGSTSNPSQQLDQLRGAGDVKRVGTDTIRGAPTTHYKTTIDLRKAADRTPADRRAAAQRSVEQLIKLSGTRTFPAEAWIDKQGRLRRMKMAFKVKGQSLAMTMDLFDFGAREAIKAPPASDTKDVTDLATKQAASD